MSSSNVGAASAITSSASTSELNRMRAAPLLADAQSMREPPDVSTRRREPRGGSARTHGSGVRLRASSP